MFLFSIKKERGREDPLLRNIVKSSQVTTPRLLPQKRKRSNRLGNKTELENSKPFKNHRASAKTLGTHCIQTNGNIDEDIKQRIRKASVAFKSL